MPYESKPNQCGLFKNDKNDRSDFNGRVDIACWHCGANLPFWVNGFNKIAASGLNYINLVFKRRDDSAPHGEGDRRDR